MAASTLDVPLGRFAIFTAQFGNVDPIMPVLRPVPGVEYLVLTDRMMRVPRPWTIRLVDLPAELPTNRHRNRYCKFHATRLLADFDRSLYIDAHPQMTGDLTDLLVDFVRSGRSLGLMKHDRSVSVDDEIERSLKSGRISEEDVELHWARQRARQRDAGFRDDLGVLRGMVILRDHRREVTERFEDVWWEEFSTGVTRDQVALPFAVWSTGIDLFQIPDHWLRPPYLRRFEHLPARRRRQRLARWFEARRAPERGPGLIAMALRPVDTIRTLRRDLDRTVTTNLSGRPIGRWAMRALHPIAAVRAFVARDSRPDPSKAPRR